MVEPKKILILTADAGFGHRSAANAVNAAIQVMYGDRVITKIANPLNDRRVPKALRRTQDDYDRLVHEMPKLVKFGFSASDSTVPITVVESTLAVVLFYTMRDLLRSFQPDAILTTYPLYLSPLSAVFTLERVKVPLLTVVTDLATVHSIWFNDVSDFCLVATQAVKDLALKAGMPPDKIRITGTPVSPILAEGKSERDSLRSQLGWQPDLVTVLAVGSKRVRHLLGSLKVLNHSGMKLQLVLVAGGDDHLYQQFEQIDWHVPVFRYNYVTNIPELMQASDCLISKAGGLILPEALACGLPVLLVDVLPGQEAGNAQFVIEGGAGELAQTPLETLEILFHWLDQGGKLLAQRAENARRLGRPRAAFDIAELVWAAVKFED
jgi:UDP-N-acetylglucosamine:LPS N-acetylglucosamine transferase